MIFPQPSAIPATVVRPCAACAKDTTHRTEGRLGGRSACQVIACTVCGRGENTFIRASEAPPPRPALRLVE